MIVSSLGQFYRERVYLRSERAGRFYFVFFQQLLGLFTSELIISSISSSSGTLLQSGPHIFSRELGSTGFVISEFIKHLVVLVVCGSAVDAVEYFIRKSVVI